MSLTIAALVFALAAAIMNYRDSKKTGIILIVIAAGFNIANVFVQKKEISNLRPRVFPRFAEFHDLTTKDSVKFALQLLNADTELPVRDVEVNFGDNFTPQSVGIIYPGDSRTLTVTIKLDSDFIKTSTAKPSLPPDDKHLIRVKYNGTKEQVFAIVVQPKTDSTAIIWEWFVEVGSDKYAPGWFYGGDSENYSEPITLGEVKAIIEVLRKTPLKK